MDATWPVHEFKCIELPACDKFENPSHGETAGADCRRGSDSLISNDDLNGIYQDRKVIYPGTVCELTCDTEEGYDFPAGVSQNVECGADGSWSKRPRCERTTTTTTTTAPPPACYNPLPVDLLEGEDALVYQTGGEHRIGSGLGWLNDEGGGKIYPGGCDACARKCTGMKTGRVSRTCASYVCAHSEGKCWLYDAPEPMSGSLNGRGGGKDVHSCDVCAQMCDGMDTGHACVSSTCAHVSGKKKCWLYDALGGTRTATAHRTPPTNLAPTSLPADSKGVSDRTFCTNNRKKFVPVTETTTTVTTTTKPKWSDGFDKYFGKWELVRQNVKMSITETITTSVVWSEEVADSITDGINFDTELGRTSEISLEVGRTSNFDKSKTGTDTTDGEQSDEICVSVENSQEEIDTKEWQVELDGKVGRRQRRGKAPSGGGSVTFGGSNSKTKGETNGKDDCSTKMTGQSNERGWEKTEANEDTFQKNINEATEKRQSMAKEFSSMISKTINSAKTSENSRSVTFDSHCGDPEYPNVYRFFIHVTSKASGVTVRIPTEFMQCIGNKNVKPQCPPQECAGEGCSCCKSVDWAPSWYKTTMEIRQCTCMDDNDAKLKEMQILNRGADVFTKCHAAAVHGMCDHETWGPSVTAACECNCKTVADANQRARETTTIATDTTTSPAPSPSPAEYDDYDLNYDLFENDNTDHNNTQESRTDAALAGNTIVIVIAAVLAVIVAVGVAVWVQKSHAGVEGLTTTTTTTTAAKTNAAAQPLQAVVVGSIYELDKELDEIAAMEAELAQAQSQSQSSQPPKVFGHTLESASSM
jgi:hypothetical protein